MSKVVFIEKMLIAYCFAKLNLTERCCCSKYSDGDDRQPRLHQSLAEYLQN